MASVGPTPARPAPVIVQGVPASTVTLPPCRCHDIDLRRATPAVQVDPVPPIKATC